MIKYKPVIGLEIHLQVKTKSKMFCRCSTDYFHKSPNTHVCEVCYGLPGALPRPNRTAFEKAIKLALALNCEVNHQVKFDRKNYFYPDLPKGYQISQFDQPIGENGFVEIEAFGDSRRIRIERVHLEEDTAKSIHTEDNASLIDFNKSGIPLIEMVTKPDFESREEVIAFAKRLRQIVRYTDVSDAEMQKGQMRFELNISLREADSKELPGYKVEVKNIGSISVLEKVIDFEMERQSKLLDEGTEMKQETRGLKDMSGETLFQRSKESSKDYRYFPEPDIAPIKISDDLIQDFKKQIPELPLERKNRYLSLKLELEQADIFIENTDRGDYLDKVLIRILGDDYDFESISDDEYFLITEASKWINTDIAGILVKKKKNFDDLNLEPSDLIALIDLIKNKKITAQIAKQVVEKKILDKSEKRSVEEIVKEDGLIQIQDDGEVDKFVEMAIEQNEKVVKDIKKNPNAIKFLVGQVMKFSKGRVNPKVAEEKLRERLEQKS